MSEHCPECGGIIEIGRFPFCPHEWLTERRPFVPWIDENISPDGPVEITSLGQWNRLMRLNQMDIRDKMSKGDLAARADRCHEQRREQERCR